LPNRTSFPPLFRGIFLHLVPFVAFAAPPIPLTATLASATVPPGGTAQLQFFLTNAQTLISGSAMVTLDPAIFDNITAADVYSATGDQIGTANIQGRQVDIEFNSQTGGVGRLPSLPVLTITVPILSTALPGATSTPTIKPGATSWIDTQGQQYNVTLTSGSITVGGSLSIRSVEPDGASVTISGTGFTSNTTAQIDGIAIATTQFISAQQLAITLATAIDLSARRITVQNPTGPAATSFYTLHGDFSQRPTSGPLSTIQPIFPLQLYPAANVLLGLPSGDLSQYEIALQNPTPNPVKVMLNSVFGFTLNSAGAALAITVPPGTDYLERVDLGAMVPPYQLFVNPEAPIRMAVIGPSYFGAVTAMPLAPTVVGLIPNGTSQSEFRFNSITVNWIAGSPSPTPTVLAVTNPLAVPFTVSASTSSGGRWLAVSPQQGVTCTMAPGNLPTRCSDPSLVTVTTDPSNLSPGAYEGTLTFTPQAFNAQPTVLPVLFNVFAGPAIFSNQNQGTIGLGATSTSQPPVSVPIQVMGSVDPVAFVATASTQSGQNWLSVNPSQGQTPATLNVTFTPSAVTPSNLTSFKDTGAVTIHGPNNTLTVFISAQIQAPPPFVVSPGSMTFSAQLGQPAPPSQILFAQSSVLPLTFSVQTATGGNWLSLLQNPVVGNSYNDPVSVDLTALSPATYQGAITVAAPASAGAPYSVTVPVTLNLTVTPPPPPPVGTVPIVTSILNGASQSPGALAPGEILTIFGQNFGPAIPAGLILTGNKVSTGNNDVQVLFDNVPAPLLYVSATQIDAIVPYEVSAPSTNVVVHYNATAIPAGAYAVTPSSPAIFTLNSTGQGPAAVLNQDASINSPSNPAARGSIIQIYATGEGATEPPGVTGSITASTGTQPQLPVSLTVGGLNAIVTYSAEAPGEVSGVLQVNAVIPQSTTPGLAVPVVLTVGAAQSPTAATIAVK
jgi:uncharacterized protein (TIGR03437 family)